MAESSACLMRSFSQPSPTSQDSREGDPLHRALTTSVSFGRFMSESLAWERWSSFTQNRYLEEVEKYSKPGSVAEKKAFFEAHYKRKAAQKPAASIEQQNAAVNHIGSLSLNNVIDNSSSIELAEVQEACHVATEKGQQHEENLNSDLNLSVDECGTDKCGRNPLEGCKIESNQIEGTAQAIEQPNSEEKEVESSILPECSQSPLECRTHNDQIQGTEQGIVQPTFVEYQAESSILPEYGKSHPRECGIENKQIGGTEQEIEHPTFVQKQVQSFMLLEDAHYITDQQEVKAPIQEVDAIVEVSAFSDKKKLAASSAKLSGHRQDSRLRPPLKPSSQRQPKIGFQATSYSKRTERQSVEKKRSTPKSLHMSINFGSRVCDTSKTSSPELHKAVNSRLVRNLSRTTRESTKQQTPIRASSNVLSKHLSATPGPAIGRTKIVRNHQISESMMTRDGKSESLYMRPKVQCPTVSASFNLRTEERAAKRKEMLQQKLSMEAAKKEQLQARLKGKVRKDAKDVQQSVASQGKANAGFHVEPKPLDVQMKKITRTQTCSPGIERKQESEVLRNNSRPTWRHSVKADSFKDLLGKNHRPPTYSTKLFLQKNSMNENTSPNIQV